jgi:protein SCO1/2
MFEGTSWLGKHRIRGGRGLEPLEHSCILEGDMRVLITLLCALGTVVGLASPETNAPTINAIPRFSLTNELGQPFNFQQFPGQAVALTFFFTRCPIPEFCPRLSRSFAEASQKLATVPKGPTNWHLVSVSFDPADTPSVLRKYAQLYHYDSNHWSFVTGDAVDVRTLTHGFGLSVEPASGIFSHDFRTVIFDATGRLQNIYPFSGDTSEFLVQEILKAAKAKP